LKVDVRPRNCWTVESPLCRCRRSRAKNELRKAEEEPKQEITRTGLERAAWKRYNELKTEARWRDDHDAGRQGDRNHCERLHYSRRKVHVGLP
jgi:hypothetical protein